MPSAVLENTPEFDRLRGNGEIGAGKLVRRADNLPQPSLETILSPALSTDEFQENAMLVRCARELLGGQKLI